MMTSTSQFYFQKHILVRNEGEKRKILEKEVVQKGENFDGLTF